MRLEVTPLGKATEQDKQRRPTGVSPLGHDAPTEQKCLAKGGAKSSAWHYATYFYAKPAMEPRSRRGSSFIVVKTSGTRDVASG